MPQYRPAEQCLSQEELAASWLHRAKRAHRAGNLADCRSHLVHVQGLVGEQRFAGICRKLCRQGLTCFAQMVASSRLREADNFLFRLICLWEPDVLRQEARVFFFHNRRGRVLFAQIVLKASLQRRKKSGRCAGSEARLIFRMVRDLLRDEELMKAFWRAYEEALIASGASRSQLKHVAQRNHFQLSTT